MATTQEQATPNHTQIASNHARQRFWQVLFPVIIASLLVIGLLVYLIFASRGSGVSLEQLGGVASIILILPVLPVLFLVLAIFVGKIYLLAKLTGVIPDLAQKVIIAFGKARTEIQKVADGAADPIIKINELNSKANQIFSSLQNRLK